MGYSQPPASVTYEKFYSGSLANGSSYTPNKSGAYIVSTDQSFLGLQIEFYSTVGSQWCIVAKKSSNSGYGWQANLFWISDGTNARINNQSGIANYIVVMRRA